VSVGPTFGAVCYIAGTRQGRTVLYRENFYPFHALGEVTFLWRPLSAAASDSNSVRTLWVWTHPACYSDILTELKSVFRLTEADCRSVPDRSDCDAVHRVDAVKSTLGKRKKKRKHGVSCQKRPKLENENTVDTTPVTQQSVERYIISQDSKVTHMDSDKVTLLSQVQTVCDVKIEQRDADVEDISGIKSQKTVQNGDPHFLSKADFVRNVYENDKVHLESLKDELCRFRLIGPKSHQVIVKALCLAEAPDIHVSDNMTDNRNTDQQVSADARHRWWDDYVVSEHGMAEITRQASNWKKLAAIQNAAELPPCSVHGLTVRDPRLFLPQRRTSAMYSADGEYVSCSHLLPSITEMVKLWLWSCLIVMEIIVL